MRADYANDSRSSRPRVGRLIAQWRALKGWASSQAPGARLAGGATLLFVNSLVGAFTGVLFWTIAAQMHSIAAVGFSSAVVSTATLVAIFANLGLNAVVARYLPSAGDRARAMSMASTAIPALAAAAVVSLILALPWWPLAGDISDAGSQGMLIFGALTIATAAMLVQDSIFTARRQANIVLARGVCSGVLRLALLPLASESDFGLVGVFLAGAVASVALGVPAWYRKLPHTERVEQPNLGEMARYGGVAYLSGLFSQVPQLLYPALIASQVSHQSAGAFSFAWMAAAMLMQLPPTAANVLLSQLVRDPADAQERIRAMARVMLACVAGLSLIVGVGMMLFASLFLPSVAGETMAYLTIVLLATLPYSLVRISSMRMALVGELKLLLFVNGAVMVIAVGFPLALLPAYGVLGLEAGWLTSQAIGVLMVLYFGKKVPSTSIL